MMKKIFQVIVVVAALAGFWFGGKAAYEGIQWIRASHAQAQIVWAFLAEPIAKTAEGKPILRGDVIDTLIRERLNAPPQAATPATPSPKPSK